MSERLTLYHVSGTLHTIGTVLNSDQTLQISYQERILDPAKAWTEKYLEDSRPHDKASRKQSYFAFDNISSCVAFAQTENIQNPIYYRVSMLNPVKCPMRLTNVIREGNGDGLNQNISKEYWESTQNWKVFEYLSPQMEILNIVDASQPGLRFMGMEMYTDDVKLSNHLFSK